MLIFMEKLPGLIQPLEDPFYLLCLRFSLNLKQAIITKFQNLFMSLVRAHLKFSLSTCRRGLSACFVPGTHLLLSEQTKTPESQSEFDFSEIKCSFYFFSFKNVFLFKDTIVVCSNIELPYKTILPEKLDLQLDFSGLGKFCS